MENSVDKVYAYQLDSAITHLNFIEREKKEKQISIIKQEAVKTGYVLDIDLANASQEKIYETRDIIVGFILQKLENYKNNNSICINNNNNNSNTISIENRFQAIYDDTSISDDIKNKLKEIEDMLNKSLNENKNTKWSKIKDKVSWFIEKGFDAFSLVAPLIFQKMNNQS